MREAHYRGSSITLAIFGIEQVVVSPCCSEDKHPILDCPQSPVCALVARSFHRSHSIQQHVCLQTNSRHKGLTMLADVLTVVLLQLVSKLSYGTVGYEALVNGSSQSNDRNFCMSAIKEKPEYCCSAGTRRYDADCVRVRGLAANRRFLWLHVVSKWRSSLQRSITCLYLPRNKAQHQACIKLCEDGGYSNY